MIEILEPLAEIPGVRLVGLVTRDGVPVAVPGLCANSDGDGDARTIDVEAAAAVATQWLSETTRAIGALTWPQPDRVVLRAARGCLVLVQSPGSVLMAITDTSVDLAELQLRMNGAAGRIGRALRDRAGRADEAATEPPAALPAERPEAHYDDVPAHGPIETQDSHPSADS